MSTFDVTYARQCDISLVAEVVADLPGDQACAFLTQVFKRADALRDGLAETAFVERTAFVEMSRAAVRRELGQLADLEMACMFAVADRIDIPVPF